MTYSEQPEFIPSQPDDVFILMPTAHATDSWIQGLYVGESIWCLCQKSKMYYDSKIISKNAEGASLTFKVHFEQNYNRTHDQTFNFEQAKASFLPHNPSMTQYCKKYNKELTALRAGYDMIPRFFLEDHNDDVDDDFSEEGNDHELIVSPVNLETIDRFNEADRSMHIHDFITKVPPRYTVHEILCNCDKEIDLFSSLKEVTMDKFCGLFERKFFSKFVQYSNENEIRGSQKYVSDLFKRRNLEPLTIREIQLSYDNDGGWRSDEVPMRFHAGSIHLIRFMKLLKDQLQDVDELTPEQTELKFILSELAGFMGRHAEYLSQTDYVPTQNQNNNCSL